jgi:uncharacterized membrane protein
MKPSTLLVLVLICLGVLLRVVTIERQGLWADEVFSLAIATGHSLEHPASKAQAELGDYVETPRPLRVPEYQRYLQYGEPPAGAARILRAVLLSDTSPPLYYLLLGAWTRGAGTSDAALRLFSVFWAVASFPLMWALAKEIGGRPAVVSAIVLFALSPVCLYYSTEGRMYSLLWFLVLSLAWLTLKVNQRASAARLILWVLTAAAGLLTHYFFIFPFGAACVWLLLHPQRLSRLWVGLNILLTGIIVLPWYSKLPESLANWRVTQDWLYMPSGSRTLGAMRIPWSLVASGGVWGSFDVQDQLVLALILVLAVFAAVKLSWRVFSKRRQLVWFWLATACLGPVVFDLLMGTYTTLVPRYAVAGMPAALLLIALALSRVRPAIGGLALLLILTAWLPGVRAILMNTSRTWEPFREVASTLERTAIESEILIVHSIPSGVLGVARYVRKPLEMYSWVGQLKQRQSPEDVQFFMTRPRIVLVKIHTVGEPAPEETWLRDNADVVEELHIESADILYFVPRRERAAGVRAMR